MPYRQLIVPGRKRPHEVVILFFCILSGATFLVRGAPAPRSFDNVVQPWVLPVWNMLMLTGGVVGLLGAYWKRNLYRGLLGEQAGMVMVTAAILLYGIAIFAATGRAGLGAGGALLAWAASCAWRAMQIQNDLRLIRATSAKLDRRDKLREEALNAGTGPPNPGRAPDHVEIRDEPSGPYTRPDGDGDGP